MAKILYFGCSSCDEKIQSSVVPTVCPKCRAPLLVRYPLDNIKNKFKYSTVNTLDFSIWCFREVLPDVEPVTMGEGFTPLISSRKFHNVFIKDESRNPTGSYEARGMAVAVSMARRHGLRTLAIASEGSSSGALAAYSAASGVEAKVFMPQNSLKGYHTECQAYGAQLTLVDGSVSDCHRLVDEGSAKEGWHDISNRHEPFRLEGVKTMGYEVFAQLGGNLPDAIICSAPDGLIGMWKSFDEMQQLGWIGSERPKMIATSDWKNGNGDRDFLLQQVLDQSAGTAVSVTNDERMHALRHWATVEGLCASPEGAASFAGYLMLLDSGVLAESEKVVLFNTVSGLKYIDVIGKYFKWTRSELPKSRNIGGIIQPY